MKKVLFVLSLMLSVATSEISAELTHHGYAFDYYEFNDLTDPSIC